jgi:hypothetical protein
LNLGLLLAATERIGGNVLYTKVPVIVAIDALAYGSLSGIT